MGNEAVVKAFQGLFADETVYTDAPRFEAGLDKVLDVFVELPRDERMRIADVIGRNIVRGSTPVPVKRAVKTAAKKTVAAARGTAGKAAAKAPDGLVASSAKVSTTLSRLSGIKLIEAQSDAVLRNELTRGTVSRAALRDGFLNDVFDLVLESGFNIALGISSHRGDATLADNRIAGEVVLMNELERAGTGAPASQVGADPELAVRLVDGDMWVATGGGRLHCSGNQIQRLWALVPSAAIQDGRVLGVQIPGWNTATLTGNQLGDFGQSVVARMLNLSGNHIANGNPSGVTLIARLFSVKLAITGTTAQFADEFTPVFVTVNVSAGSETGAAVGNLVLVRRFPGV
jgi:hypothetical protein